MSIFAASCFPVTFDSNRCVLHISFFLSHVTLLWCYPVPSPTLCRCDADRVPQHGECRVDPRRGDRILHQPNCEEGELHWVHPSREAPSETGERHCETRVDGAGRQRVLRRRDADVDAAVDAAMASKFRNAGQTCVCADRFLVHRSVHDEFVNKLASRVRALVVGPGMDPDTQMGPLISVGAVESVQTKVLAAVQNDGATLLCQPESPSDLQRRLGPQFYPPTILTNVSTDSDIWKTETFGPVAPVVRFDTEEEALAVANNVTVGLASYFCTKDLSRAFRFAHR